MMDSKYGHKKPGSTKDCRHPPGARREGGREGLVPEPSGWTAWFQIPGFGTLEEPIAGGVWHFAKAVRHLKWSIAY